MNAPPRLLTIAGENVPMLIRMSQEMPAKGEKPFVTVALMRARVTLAFAERVEQTFKTALDEIFLVFIMSIERRAAHVCSIDDLLHRYQIEFLFLNQRQ